MLIAFRSSSLAVCLLAAVCLRAPVAVAMDSPADTAMDSGMAKMQHDMQTAPMTGDPDHDFVVMMLPHHQGAVAMAQTELRYGKDPSMRRLARDIVAAQDREIVVMRHWLSTHPAAGQ